MIYWKIADSMSYNALFNFIVGNRGCGKTFGCKKKVIENFINKKEKFVYVRRFKTEFKKIKTFFNDIKDHFEGHKFEVKGNNFYIDDELAGYGIVLSTAKVEKSNSYPDVTMIIFDEFILDKGVHHYIPDEVTCFLELYETIARMRDVRVYFISNAITFTNPYFLEFNITKPMNKKQIACKDDILIQLVADQAFIDAKNETRFARIIKGTAYGNYAIENEFLRDNNYFVCDQPKNMQYYFTIKSVKDFYGVWISYDEGIMYVSSKYDPDYKIVYATKLENHEPNVMLLKGVTKSSLFTSFTKAFKMGLVYFDSIKTKNLVVETIKNTL